LCDGLVGGIESERVCDCAKEKTTEQVSNSHSIPRTQKLRYTPGTDGHRSLKSPPPPGMNKERRPSQVSGAFALTIASVFNSTVPFIPPSGRLSTVDSDLANLGQDYLQARLISQVASFRRDPRP